MGFPASDHAEFTQEEQGGDDPEPGLVGINRVQVKEGQLLGAPAESIGPDDDSIRTIYRTAWDR
jgi:hypothetical protein